MDKLSPSTKGLMIAILVVVVIVLATALSFGGHHKKVEDKGLGRISAPAGQVVVI